MKQDKVVSVLLTGWQVKTQANVRAVSPKASPEIALSTRES